MSTKPGTRPSTSVEGRVGIWALHHLEAAVPQAVAPEVALTSQILFLYIGRLIIISAIGINWLRLEVRHPARLERKRARRAKKHPAAAKQ